jgi:2',3'-cyclic-nucleotide 2'-phosphodiesterase (5'-nucleotidase family)
MEETETEVTEVECQIAYLVFELDRINNLFFAVTFTEDWKSYTLEEQLAFRNSVEVLSGVANIHREKLDADIWKGHANGTVNQLVTSIRKEREGDKPGKKAEPPTAASLLAKRLKK